MSGHTIPRRTKTRRGQALSKRNTGLDRLRRRKRAVFGIETDIKKPRVAVEKKRKVNGRKKALYSVNEHIRCGRKAAKSCRKSIKANRKIAVIDG